MTRIILFAAIISFSIHQIILLPINELEEPQRTEEPYKTDENYELAEPEETDNIRSVRLKRQADDTENSEEADQQANPDAEKPATQPTKSEVDKQPATQPLKSEVDKPSEIQPPKSAAQTTAGAMSNLQLSFMKQFYLFGVTLSILYKMKTY